MGPIDYSLDVQQPFQAVLQGYQAGAAIRNDRFQQQQQQAALAQQQAQLDQQQALQNARAQAFSNPTADNFTRLMTIDPKSSEAYQRAWNTKNTQQQQAMASDLLQWGAAIKSGKPQIAADALNKRADLLEQQNGGAATPDSKALRVQAQLAADHPEFALGQIQALLAANPNGKDAAETLKNFQATSQAEAQAPGALRKVNADAAAAESDAKTKAVTADFAHQNAVADLEKKGWDVKNIQSEIGYRKESNRIAALNAKISSETNELRRQELKLQVDKATQALAQSVRDKAADAESAATTIDNSLNTIERLKKNPALNDVLGSIEGSDYYPTTWAAGAAKVANLGNPFYTPTSGDDRADAKALIQTLGSQAFLSQAANLKGMGALSNAEGEKLQSALTNLSRQQSETQFRANLDEASRLLTKSRETLSKRTGVPLGKPDTPAAPGARPPLSSFLTPGG